MSMDLSFLLHNLISIAGTTDDITAQSFFYCIRLCSCRFVCGSKVLDGVWTSSPLVNDSLSTKARQLNASLGDSSSIADVMPRDTKVDDGGSFVSMIDLLKNVGHNCTELGEVNGGCYTLFGADTPDSQFGKSPPQAELVQPTNVEKSYSLWGEPNREKSSLPVDCGFSVWRDNEKSSTNNEKISHSRPEMWQWNQQRCVSGDLHHQLHQDTDHNDELVDNWTDMAYYLRNLTTDKNRGCFPGSVLESGTRSASCGDGKLSYGNLSHVMKQSGSRKSGHPKENRVPVHLASATSKPSSDQQAKKLSSEHQFFMSELERLPPLLRQQYLDFMFAKQQIGALAAVGYPCFYPVPPVGAVCPIELSTLAVPQAFTQSKPVHPVLLVPKPMPSYGVQVPLMTVPQQLQPLVKTVK
jgi:hypothetical protein